MLVMPGTAFAHRNLPRLLLQAREAVMQHTRPSLREHGLSDQQWRVLRALSSCPEMDASKLAEETYLLGPSISRILRDLEAEQLITTRPDGEDQRRKLVHLAPEGEDRIRRIAPLSEAIYADITARFGEARLVELQNLLKDLQQSMR